MKPVFISDGPETRDEEAGAWCARLAVGALSPDEQAEFDRWTAADASNAAAFDRALQVWQSLHVISDAPELIAMRADALDALRRANQRRWSRRIGVGWQRPLALVASLVLVLLGGLSLLSAQPDYYSTGVGERRAFRLADGSQLSLDAATKVSVEYEADQRRLTLLAGRAKFDVAKDPSRPFTVTAGSRTVIATGTAFSVELLGKKVHVIVYDGSVAVIRGAVPPPDKLLRIKARQARTVAATSLVPGKALIADETASTSSQVIAADVGRSLSWEGGQLDFVDEPLASAVERLNRYSADRIVVADAKVAAMPVNGVFNAGDSAAFVEAVQAAYDIRAERGGREIILSSDHGERSPRHGVIGSSE